MTVVIKIAKFIIKFIGKIILIPIWLILLVACILTYMAMALYETVSGLFSFAWKILFILTLVWCKDNLDELIFLGVLEFAVLLVLFMGVAIQTFLDTAREYVGDLILH